MKFLWSVFLFVFLPSAYALESETPVEVIRDQVLKLDSQLSPARLGLGQNQAGHPVVAFNDKYGRAYFWNAHHNQLEKLKNKKGEHLHLHSPQLVLVGSKLLLIGAGESSSIQIYEKTDSNLKLLATLPERLHWSDQKPIVLNEKAISFVAEGYSNGESVKADRGLTLVTFDFATGLSFKPIKNTADIWAEASYHTPGQIYFWGSQSKTWELQAVDPLTGLVRTLHDSKDTVLGSNPQIAHYHRGIREIVLFDTKSKTGNRVLTKLYDHGSFMRQRELGQDKNVGGSETCPGVVEEGFTCHFKSTITRALGMIELDRLPVAIWTQSDLDVRQTQYRPEYEGGPYPPIMFENETLAAKSQLIFQPLQTRAHAQVIDGVNPLHMEYQKSRTADTWLLAITDDVLEGSQGVRVRLIEVKL